MSDKNIAQEPLSLELERMRARLLDLSARNSLLNYAHPRASCLRIVDEVPAAVLERLLNRNGFRFAALESPDEPTSTGASARRGWQRKTSAATVVEDRDDATLFGESNQDKREAAKNARLRQEAETKALAERLAVNPSYDLPAIRDSEKQQHQDELLQTLLAPEALEKRLQKIQSAAVTAIQESGANMLHLLFGFVEWQDVAGGKARMAPLVLVPVALARLGLDPDTHTYPYSISASGEDWSTNVTLQEKCRKEFGFVLPDIEPEENLEAYFSRIERVLKSAPRGWRIRRQLTLGLVSFGKILMWRDLDPSTWPKEKPLTGSNILRQMLGSTEDSERELSVETRTAEYAIDRLPAEYGQVPPLVMPADSSQHSVLVDVQRGHNLVVQGPPGTGKSQTITNIIAGAIAAGKKILFVAEKKAALDVVWRRLTDTGLGPFCLSLHSHTSNKRAFLDELKKRLAVTGPIDNSVELRATTNLLHESRDVLTAHAERLNAPFGSHGDTPFKILWRVRRLASDLPDTAIAKLREVSIPNAISVDAAEVAREHGALEAFAAVYSSVIAEVPAGMSHPWEGVTRTDLTFEDTNLLLSLSRECLSALSQAERARIEMQAVSGGAPCPNQIVPLVELADKCGKLTVPGAGVSGELVDAIHRRTGATSVSAALSAADASYKAWDAVIGPWGKRGALSSAHGAAYKEALRQAALSFGAGATSGTLNSACILLQSTLDHLRTVETLAIAVAADLDVKCNFPGGLALGLVDLSLAAGALPEGALDLRSDALAAFGAGERIAALAQTADALRKAAGDLNARFAPEMRPSLADLREMAAALAEAPGFLPVLFSGRYRRAVARYRAMSGGKRLDRAGMSLEIVGLIRHTAAFEAFEKDDYLGKILGQAAKGVDSPFPAVLALLAWAKRGTASFRIWGDAGRILSEKMWSGSANGWLSGAIRTASVPAAAEIVEAVLRSLDKTALLLKTDRAAMLALPLALVRKSIDDLRVKASRGGIVAKSSAATLTATISEIHNQLGKLERAWVADEMLSTHETTLRDLSINLPLAPKGDNERTISSVRDALAYISLLFYSGLPGDLVGWLSSGDIAGRMSLLKRAAASAGASLSRVASAVSAFVNAGGVDRAAWFGNGEDEASLSAQAARFDRAINAAQMLPTFCKLLRTRAVVMTSSFPAAVQLLQSNVVSAPQLPVAYSYVLGKTLADAVFRAHPELDQFAGMVHNTRRERFASLDEKHIKLTQRQIAQHSVGSHDIAARKSSAITGVGYGPVRNLSGLNLIKHEIDKEKRHIPIRELFRRAGDAIQSLKPCFMLGPQAVAQYLAPGYFNFDLIVMDEASQLRPEDALGAIARGAQLVVVGDPKQLGPSSYFSSQGQDADEVDEVAAELAAGRPDVTESKEETLPPGASVLERSESILLAASRRYPTRMLRWHYRSKYPELIAFSNQEFYHDLILFPHPGSDDPDEGVNFRHVENATYASSTNELEAVRIVRAVQEHAAEHAERSLLVVAMNQPQRELIDELIQRAEKEDPALAAFRARHAETLEPLGVKNLENVQGDERDVIFVSVTYGPNAQRVLAQNFGPVNLVGGERRLNVLFTRAKFRLDVFCSFDPASLRITESSPRGLVVLRDYLRYAKEGTLSGGKFTGKEPDSDFEIEVARALERSGYTVHPQVGVAGYFLDMAVVDPNLPGRYLLAIECDGATYHSAKSARDRDKLRQSVLEGLGWNVHRVWSTDWFRDPEGETRRVTRRLESAVRT